MEHSSDEFMWRRHDGKGSIFLLEMLLYACMWLFICAHTPYNYCHSDIQPSRKIFKGHYEIAFLATKGKLWFSG